MSGHNLLVYLAFAAHWGFTPLPTQPRTPHENGKQERSGGFLGLELAEQEMQGRVALLFEAFRQAGGVHRPRQGVEGGGGVLAPGGTASEVSVPGYTLAGKTGTAERGVMPDQSWYVALAPADDPEIVVAVIDTGVDWTHTDLASRIWTNPGEIPGNGNDDDGNGKVDDVHGYDFANDDGDPLDDSGHGTHVGGTVAGDGTGGTSTGVAPEAQLMAVKVLTASGAGTFAGIMAGVEYAVENGAEVLNLSLGGYCTSLETRSLLRANADAVAAAGVTMCVASANDRCKQRPPNLVRSPGDAPEPAPAGRALSSGRAPGADPPGVNLADPGHRPGVNPAGLEA